MKKLALTLAALLTLAGCSAPADSIATDACYGVSVKVNFGSLKQTPIDTCVSVEGDEILAVDALEQAGVAIEGTVTYPDAIVCRVNGLPSEDVAIEVAGEDPYFEGCQDMPPAFAYWALWVINDPEAGWEYAMEGASTLKLTKGQSVGLAFASGDQAPTPDN